MIAIHDTKIILYFLFIKIKRYTVVPISENSKRRSIGIKNPLYDGVNSQVPTGFQLLNAIIISLINTTINSTIIIS